MKPVNKWMSKGFHWAVAALLITGMGACRNDDVEPTSQTIADIVQQDNNFSILRAAVTHAGLGDALRSGTLTVFAPTNEAFQASGFADAAAITALPAATVRSVLEYHVLNSTVPAAQIAVGTNTAVGTLAGRDVYITKSSASSGVSVNNARVVTADVSADNGVIHVIDRVLMPPTQTLLEVAQNNPDFTFLVAAATRAASAEPTIVQALSSSSSAFTVFAPTNNAFMAAGFSDIAAINAADPGLLAAVVMYHVVPGRVFSPTLSSGNVTAASGDVLEVDVNNGVTLTGSGNNNQPSRVVQADIVATNGVVHVIDRVLLP